MNRKHLRRSPLSPTMSKFLGKIADRKIIQLSGQMLPSRHDPLRTPYDRYIQFLSLMSYKNREVTARSSRGSPYGARMMTYDVSTGYGLTIFKLCNSAYFYKIVEATEIVGSRRIVGSS